MLSLEANSSPFGYLEMVEPHAVRDAGVVRSLKEFMPLGQNTPLLDWAGWRTGPSSSPITAMLGKQTSSYASGSGQAFVFAGSEHVDRSLSVQEAWLKGLPDNWDEDGARPIDRDLLSTFIGELRSVALVTPIRPEIIPGSDGSLQAEWRAGRYEVFYTAEQDGDRCLYVRYSGRETACLFRQQASAALPQTLRIATSELSHGQTNASG